MVTDRWTNGRTVTGCHTKGEGGEWMRRQMSKTGCVTNPPPTNYCSHTAETGIVAGTESSRPGGPFTAVSENRFLLRCWIFIRQIKRPRERETQLRTVNVQWTVLYQALFWSLGPLAAPFTTFYRVHAGTYCTVTHQKQRFTC